MTTPRPRRRAPAPPAPLRGAKHEPQSELEMQLQVQMRACHVQEPVWNFYWHPRRMWHSDAAYPERLLLIEVDGGVTPFRDKKTGELRQGRHNTILGFEGDCEKLSEAAILGYRVIRVTRRMIDDGRAITLIERALAVGRAVA